MSQESREVKEKKSRIVLEVAPEFNVRIEDLRKLVQADTRTELIRDAIQLYEFLAERQRDGWEFKLKSPQGKEETLRFFLYPKPVTDTVER